MTIQEITAQAEQFIAPVRTINEVALNNTEKFIGMQVAAFNTYATLGIAHMRAALEVKDADSMKDFMSKHREYVETVAEKAAKDASAVLELGNDYAADVQKIIKDSADKAGVLKTA